MYKKPSKYETVSLFLVDPNFEASCTKKTLQNMSLYHDWPNFWGEMYKKPAKYKPVSWFRIDPNF